jgi:hypothetical protein
MFHYITKQGGDNMENEIKNVPKKRGRPRKNPVETNSFSYEYNSSIPCSVYGGVDLVDCPVDLNMLNDFIKDPMSYNKQLRELSWWVYHTDGTISSGLDYMRTMHTLDKVVYNKSANISATYKKRKSLYKSKFESILEVIKYKQFIRDALLKDFNDGIFFYYFETTKASPDNNKFLSDIDVLNITEINQLDVNASIISLPVDYCKIIGRKNNSYNIAFDLRFFSQYASDNLTRKLKAFPKEIRDAWNDYSTGKQIQPWVRLDNNKTIVHKIKSATSDPWGIPLSVAALDDILYANHFINTKRNVLDDLNNQIFYETFPEGEKKGSSSLSDKQQKGQHDLIKSALFNSNNKYGKAFFSLASGTKLDQIKVDTSIFDEKNESNVKNNISQAIGYDSSILGGESKSNYATATLNIESISAYIYSIISEIVDELNKVINANIIKDSLCQMRLYILNTTFVNRESTFNYMKTLYAECGGSLQAVVAASGVSIDAYMSLLDEEKENDFDQKYPPHMSMYTNNGENSGRPSTDSKNPQTVQTKTNGGNKNPKPSK